MTTSSGQITPLPLFGQLPERLSDALRKIGEKYSGKGVDIFVFGSFAKGNNRRNSDLDIGVEWKGERSQKLYRKIREDVWNLPTIRRIELVDMHRVSDDFQEETKKDRIYLTHD